MSVPERSARFLELLEEGKEGLCRGQEVSNVDLVILLAGHGYKSIFCVYQISSLCVKGCSEPGADLGVGPVIRIMVSDTYIPIRSYQTARH